MTQSSDWTAPGDRAADADLPADDAPDLGRRPDPDVAPPDDFELPKPDGWTDPLSGTDGPRFWDRVVESENARWRRYGRPVTVVVVEFTGLVSDGTWLGRELVMQTFARVAQVLTMMFRTSDYQARIGPGRFGILLIDADEISAINFVDRIRAACQNELDEHSGFGMRTGWASPAEGETLHSAVDRASARLDDPAFQGTA